MHLHHLDRVYFNHIPKTAGTSFRVWLHRLFAENALLPIDHLVEFEQADLRDIRATRLLSGHFGWRPVEVGSQVGLDFEPVTLLREPVSHYASGWEFSDHVTEADLQRAGGVFDSLREVMNRARGLRKARAFSLDAFLAHRSMLNTTVRFLAGAGTQSGEPADMDQAALATAKQRLESMRFFGLVEDLTRSAVLFADAFRLPLRAIDERHNTRSGTAKRTVDPAFAEAVRTYCALDCALYAFAGDLFESRWRAVAAKHELPADAPVEAFRRPLLQQFLTTDRGVPRLAQGSIPVSSGIVTDGFAFRYPTGDGGSNLWAGPGTQSTLYLPLDRRHRLSLQVDVPVFMSLGIRDGLVMLVDEAEVPFEREFYKDEAGSYVTRLTVDVPRRRGDPPYTAIGFEVPEVISTGEPHFPVPVSFALGGSIAVCSQELASGNP